MRGYFLFLLKSELRCRYKRFWLNWGDYFDLLNLLCMLRSWNLFIRLNRSIVILQSLIKFWILSIFNFKICVAWLIIIVWSRVYWSISLLWLFNRFCTRFKFSCWLLKSSFCLCFCFFWVFTHLLNHFPMNDKLVQFQS